MLDANPNFARVRFADGRESSVSISLAHATCPSQTIENTSCSPAISHTTQPSNSSSSTPPVDSQDKQQNDIESTNLPGKNLHIDDNVTSESPSLSSDSSPAPLRADLHCAYKISKVFTLVRRGCLHYTKRRLRA